jgi:hypothetical protein
MRRPALAAAAAVIAAVVSAPVAQAADFDLAGSWNSAALRTNGVGYSLAITSAGGQGTYDGTLRFHFQDGTLGRRIPVGVALAGDRVSVVLPGGALASNTRTLHGRIGADGSFTLAKCQTLLAHVTRRTAPQMCMFQELPVS